MRCHRQWTLSGLYLTLDPECSTLAIGTQAQDDLEPYSQSLEKVRRVNININADDSELKDELNPTEYAKADSYVRWWMYEWGPWGVWGFI